VGGTGRGLTLGVRVPSIGRSRPLCRGKVWGGALITRSAQGQDFLEVR